MKIYLLKENLKPGLSAIEKIATKSVTLPVLENVSVSAEKNYLKLIATNLESTVIFKTLSKIEKEGNIIVPVKIFSNIIRSIKADKLDMEKQGNNLIISGGNEKMRLKCQNPEEFPVIPKIETQKCFTLNSSLFISGLNQVINTTSLSLNRPELSGVYFHISQDSLIMVSTDSFRLSEKKIKWSPEHNPTTTEEYSFIVPSKALNDSIPSFSDTEKELKISVGDGQVCLEDINNPQSKIQFISKLIEGEFPSYQEIIPKKFDTKMTLNRSDLLTQIRTASILSPKTNEVSLLFQPKHKKLEITSSDPDRGEYHSSLAGQIEGEQIRLEFNWKYLVDGLTNIKSQEVVFEVQKNGGPAVIRPVGDDSYIYVVMPIRSV